jgi:hypothetical protein
MATLYEIDREIMDCFDTETGEILDIERLNGLQMARDKKIENTALYYKNLLSDADAYKAEKQAFADREQAARRKADSLKQYLDYALNGEGFKTAKVAISFRNSERVVIDDISRLDMAYVKFAEPTADKTAIKKAIKDGAEVVGAHIEAAKNMQIK